ncbi:MAG TPA: ATP-binding protein, partial [Gemmatimonadaceae bacterium]|nr:ATP-binding protein [Gemmatimonadaceae bacterium]
MQLPRPLLPAQSHAVEALERAVAREYVAELAGRPGAGMTTILRTLHERLGGVLLTSRDFIEASAERHPLALDETVYGVIADALRDHAAVIVDDFHFIAMVSCCSHSYPRQNFLGAPMVALAKMARDAGKPLVVSSERFGVNGLSGRVPRIQIPAFTIDDYAALCTAHLGDDRTRALDVKKIHRFAPKLNACQLRDTCVALRDEQTLDTDVFIAYLREHHMASNVNLDVVQAVDLKDLKGLDDVLESLEANVILPLENTEVSEELNLKPKRGVLLAGPPGTGKTTIGRALARRLKSKFFLIDGTIVVGTPGFHQHIHHIFEAAKQNAPAIIFIDDTDVVFEGGHETGLYRYLLTMLDGLESASAGRICLMMTAMDVGNLPPALVRSGRIELWLETRLPNAAARAAILADRCIDLSPSIGRIDIPELADASEGLSGADLKRVVDDGKLLFAFARTRGAAMQPATAYFLSAIETVRKNKDQYAAAEARARVRHPVRPSYFD